jgi:mevalonate kinase
MSKILRLSSPGKLILCGEHAVVYGCKALACSIDLRTELEIYLIQPVEVDQQNDGIDFELGNNSFEINLLDSKRSIKFNRQFYEENFQSIQNSSFDLDQIYDNLVKKNNQDKLLDSLKLLIEALNIEWNKLRNLKVNMKTSLPLASGLGSSASYSTCLSAFFLIIAQKLSINSSKKSFSPEDLEAINKYSFYVEKLFHGKPSGIDNSVSTYGNYVLFEKGSISEKFASKLQLNVLIVNSCVPKQTSTQVDRVRKLYDTHSSIVQPIMNTINALVARFVQILKQDDHSFELNELITINQGMLHALHVSTHELARIVGLAQKYGYHAKVTGAGGGGCAYVLLENQIHYQKHNEEDRLKRFEHELKENSFVFFRTRLGCDGIRLEEFSYY